MKPGDIIVNTGKLRGQGYMWKVLAVHNRNPHQPDDRRVFVECLNIGPLHGEPENPDYHIGNRFLYLASTKEVLGKIKPPCQERLI